MPKKKKLNLIQKIILSILPLAVTLFLVVLFMEFWEFISANRLIIGIITGLIILLSIMVGVFNRKKFKRGLRRKI